jgi:holo-[acyl-carrier protein] synthase
LSVRVGIDLVEVSDVEEAVERWGQRYLTRIFTPAELETSRASSGHVRAERLAACLAAKEAALKVLLTEDDEIPWRCIELLRQAGGDTALVLTGAASACADRERITSVSVSVTTGQDHATAVVLAEQGGSERS